jgi:hypothetical protein
MDHRGYWCAIYLGGDEMTFLLANWKLCLIAFLIALCSLFYGLWQSSEAKLAKVKAAGEYAQQEKERIEKLYDKTLKETSDAWSIAVPTIRANAVAEYRKRYPGVCHTSQVPVPGAAQSTEILHGTVEERIPLDPEFIATCAEDAFYRTQVRAWVTGNQLKVE